MVAVATVHVGCATLIAGAVGAGGCAFAFAGVVGELHPLAFCCDTVFEEPAATVHPAAG